MLVLSAAEKGSSRHLARSIRALNYVWLIILCLLCSGCWDQHELQDREFVVAAAIDLADEGLKPGQSISADRETSFVQPHGEKRYRMSVQLLRFAPKGGGEGQGQDQGTTKTFVISGTGQSLFEINRDLSGQVSKPLYWEHIQAIIISDAALKQVGLKELLDWFLRDSEMRWRIRLYVTPGEARPIIEYRPPSGEAGGIYLRKMAALHSRNAHIGGALTDLGFIAQKIDNERDLMLPRIQMADNVVKLGGMAVFKQDKFVGYVDEYCVKGMKFIAATEKSAVITIDDPDSPGDILVFELFVHDTKLTPHIEGNNIYFTLDIAMWGNIDEMQTSKKRDTTDPQYIRKLEVLFAEEVKHNVLYSMQVMQSLGVDPLDFGTKIKTHEPKTWAQIKDKWDSIYPTVPLQVSVNVTIRSVGEHK